MTLLQCYSLAVEKEEIVDDPLQREVLVRMQQLENELQRSNGSWFSRWYKKQLKGIYVHGPVGAGKTYLTDLFFQHLGEKSKARFHFHHFMQQIDAQLRRLQGRRDPLRLIAKNIAKKTRVIFFDEFFVHDVAYAMILAELLQALMANGVVMIFTSNTSPDDLYLNGVQRARFLPAIALIKQRCVVLHLLEKRDYRLGRNPLFEAYLFPLNEKTKQSMEQQFSQVSDALDANGSINFQRREIFYYKRSSRSIWFDFQVLCHLPRSQLDYLELADRFDTVFLSNVPQLTENHTMQVILFIYLIDVMYDRGVKIIISAAVSVEQLYLKGEMHVTFKRTLSRLIEMQSVDYLSRHPKRQVESI